MRGTVTGTKPGDSVEVWFEGGGQKSESFTYQVVSDTNNRMLVVAAEDWSGISPDADRAGPHYAQTYLDALAANGIAADVYDVDARGRIAPDQLGVLSHYKGVIWYTGDDAVTRRAGRGAGNADRLALDEMLEMRAYMDEGGRVLYTGKQAGHAVHRCRGRGQPVLRPEGRGGLPAGRPRDRPAAVPAAARLDLRAATRSTTCCSTGSAAWCRSPVTARSGPPRSRSTASAPRSTGSPSGR